MGRVLDCSSRGNVLPARLPSARRLPANNIGAVQAGAVEGKGTVPTKALAHVLHEYGSEEGKNKEKELQGEEVWLPPAPAEASEAISHLSRVLRRRAGIRPAGKQPAPPMHPPTRRGHRRLPEFCRPRPVGWV